MLAPDVADLYVVIDFWADEAAVVVHSGATFTIWYGGEVGRGDVLDSTAPGST
jgi:hypothetical protein